MTQTQTAAVKATQQKQQSQGLQGRRGTRQSDFVIWHITLEDLEKAKYTGGPSVFLMKAPKEEVATDWTW